MNRCRIWKGIVVKRKEHYHYLLADRQLFGLFVCFIEFLFYSMAKSILLSKRSSVLHNSVQILHKNLHIRKSHYPIWSLWFQVENERFSENVRDTVHVCQPVSCQLVIMNCTLNRPVMSRVEASIVLRRYSQVPAPSLDTIVSRGKAVMKAVPWTSSLRTQLPQYFVTVLT